MVAGCLPICRAGAGCVRGRVRRDMVSRKEESDADKDEEELRGGILVLCANLNFLFLEVSADTLGIPVGV